MIGVCTDSGAQLPGGLAAHLGIAVVPLTVTVDGVDHLEGVDLDADEFWDFFADRSPSLATAAPSPGRFLEVWERLVAGGVSEIVSVHTGSEVSGTFNAARNARAAASVPVELVDTGSASFVVGLAACAAADAVRTGHDAHAAAAAAEAVARRCGNVFVVGTLEFARRGGRLAAASTERTQEIPVLALVDGQIRTVGRCDDPDGAAVIMADHVLAEDRPLRVGIGAADPSSFGVADALETLVRRADDVEVVRYRVGPSVGTHTGPGTAGAVFHTVS